MIRCALLLKELNGCYSSKKVLLVSQGNILQGMKILLHQGVHPWDGYSASAMFGTVGKEKLIGYFMRVIGMLYRTIIYNA